MNRKFLLGSGVLVLAGLTTGLIASTSVALQLNARVKDLERALDAAETQKTESAVVTNVVSLAAAVTSEASHAVAVTNVAVAAQEPKINRREMKINGLDTVEGDTVRLRLSEKPDMEVIRPYVTIDPKPAGAVAFTLDDYYDTTYRDYLPALVISGDFAFRTETTIRIRKGLPVDGEDAEANDVLLPLAEDFTTTFRRDDLKPSVSFKDSGRYLPPIGPRAIALSSVNLTNVYADVRSVPAANLVAMLALEEGAYEKITVRWGNDADGFVTDLSSSAAENELKSNGEPNREETLRFPIVPAQGEATNGVFLVSVARGDVAREKLSDGSGWWRSKDWAHRVVCVTDLGLSVRKTEKGLFAWVTSLTKGTPVSDVKVEVYSPANILVAEGHADANGWCACRTVAKGEPFAVVVTKDDGSDRSFLALRRSMNVAESVWEGVDRPAYLKDGDTAAFVWTERGIYRHEEKIFFHALLRDAAGVAPRAFPVELELVRPSGDVYAVKTLMPDRYGAVSDESYLIPADQPSGVWRLRLKTPGKNGVRLGERFVRIEEFAPPQIRVSVVPAANVSARDFAFTVSAEHLYGGAARDLRATGAVLFEDAAFAPKGWEGYTFGSEDRALKPSYRALDDFGLLDEKGSCRFEAPLLESSGKPSALVRVTAQGTVFEDGGRAVNARVSTTCHYYPYYIGTTLKSWIRKEALARPKISVACVAPDGSALREAKRLRVRLDEVSSIYSYRRTHEGWATWDSTRVREPAVDPFEIETSAEGTLDIELPVSAVGDYVLTIDDSETGVSFARKFYLGDWGDETVRAPLENPTSVSIAADQAVYRPGERPRLVVKSPFTGTALVSVYREDFLYAEVIALTNATSEIELRPVVAENAPNVDVKISVVQSAGANARRLAVRAHGEKTIAVRRLKDELPVRLSVQSDAADYRKLDIDVDAAGSVATGAVAVVTIVDSGIHLLTDEPTPDPIGSFARNRGAANPLYDLYNRILPILGEDSLKANGIKTGGGFGADMLSRVSPTPTRRFKPLALWRENVPLVAGRGHVSVELPDFIGEVRVTAVAYETRATGAGATSVKVAPKLVMQPDAPRFVAPGDRFEAVLPLANRSGAAGDVSWRIGAESGVVSLADGESTIVRRMVTAPTEPGELALSFAAEGFGESHARKIDLPVRPAVAWRETAGVDVLEPGAAYDIPQSPTFTYTIFETPLADLKSALDEVTGYPYGCLEQTSSRVFPLLTASGLLRKLQTRAADQTDEFVNAGVKRVSSMMREYDFIMWPDCDYAPPNQEVSLYAAHFLIEAERAGYAVLPSVKERVLAMLRRRATEKDANLSAYACLILALARQTNLDRMLSLYDAREALSLLARSRLALAFVTTGDRTRATELLKSAACPHDVKEASFLMLALLRLDASDARLRDLLAYLLNARDKSLNAWGTTETDAHALLALGAYYAAFPPEEGRRYVAWRKLELPDLASATNETTRLSVSRTYERADGSAADLGNLRRGELLTVTIRMKSLDARVLSDLVIEDLFPAAFEPAASFHEQAAWVLRSDVRDDRLLVFSKKFSLKADEEIAFTYDVRVVSSGDFALPGVAVEAMYQPQLRARGAARRLVVHD